MSQKTQANPMRRPARREQLLAVARDLIRRGGLAALTMENLAERANISKPVVYSHFGDRNGVAIALMEEHFIALRVFSESKLKSARTLNDYISGFVDSSFAFGTASDTPIAKITNGFSAGDEINKIFLREEAAIRRKWENILIRLGVEPETAFLSSSMLQGMIDSAVINFAEKYGEVNDALARSRNSKARASLKILLMACIHALLAGDKAREESFAEFNQPVSESVAEAYRVELLASSAEDRKLKASPASSIAAAATNRRG
jgi:AcrR family transcriptional regulator